MIDSAIPKSEVAPARTHRPWRRALRIGLVIFVVLVLIVVLLSWWMGDSFLPMEYEGFN